MAGLLTCSENDAFPSCDSDMLPFPLAELTAAGTVQDSHLFPSQDFTKASPSPLSGGKNTKFFDIDEDVLNLAKKQIRNGHVIARPFSFN